MWCSQRQHRRQTSDFILKDTENTTTNWKTKTRKNNIFHSLFAHARTMLFSLPSSQIQCPQRLQLSGLMCCRNACSQRPHKHVPPLQVPPRGVIHAVTAPLLLHNQSIQGLALLQTFLISTSLKKRREKKKKEERKKKRRETERRLWENWKVNDKNVPPFPKTVENLKGKVKNRTEVSKFSGPVLDFSVQSTSTTSQV